MIERIAMNISDRYPYEGPRTPAEAEWSAVMELCRSIFFADIPSYTQAVRKWPMYLRRDLWENTFVMFHEGQPVSSISRLTRGLVVHGQALRIGFMGGVCTHRDHRGRGLASTVLDATLQRFADEDVDVVYISGARPLYFRAGANHIGACQQYLLPSGAANSADARGVSIRGATVSDAGFLCSINAREQTRLAHDKTDYELIIQNGHCSGQPCIIKVVEADSAPAGYMAVRKSERKEGIRSQRVMEFAGDREAIFSAMVVMANGLGPDGRLVIEARPGEELETQLRSVGAERVTRRIGGTIKVTNFVRTMEKLRPYFGQHCFGWESRGLRSKGRHLGSSFAESLEFVAGKGRYVVSGEAGSLEIDGENNMIWTLLGTPSNEQVENVRATGLMEKALDACLPIPLPPLQLNVI